jgi:preprotein translocase subunit SecA
MTKLEQIEKSISALSDEELKALAVWFDELRWQRWDRQIEDDSNAGRLDALANEALADFRAGRTRPL